MKKYFILFVLLASAESYSAQSCQWEDQEIPRGESVMVKDPFLLQLITDQMMTENGVTQSHAKSEAEKSDWVGFVLQCVASFSMNKQPMNAGEVITPKGYHLVLVDHQRAWYWAMKKH